MTTATDAELAQRLLERDDTALRAVIDAHGPYVLGMARRVLVDATLAEEVAQDTFVALWRRPGAFDPDRAPLRAFLLGVARNKAIDLVRKESSRRRTTETLMAEAEAAVPTSDDSIDRVDTKLSLRRAMAGLTQLQREALTLAYFGGRTYREVAEELGIPEGTAKTRLRDGLNQLRTTIGTREAG
jgi:RNA polymerase sigma-70 factor, ECF subfamily